MAVGLIVPTANKQEERCLFSGYMYATGHASYINSLGLTNAAIEPLFDSIYAMKV